MPIQTGTAASDTLTGTADLDELIGGAGDDILLGGAGNDVLRGDEGDDRLDGGSGRDTADYSSATSAVHVDLTTSNPQDTVGAGLDTLISIESLIGSAFDDVLIGSGAYSVLRGGAGADTLTRSEGAVSFFYGAASESTSASQDVITNFFASSDEIDLTALAPTAVRLVYLPNLGTQVFAETASGTLQILVQFIDLPGFSSLRYSTSAGLEIFGSSRSENLQGYFRNDQLFGGDGDDTLFGSLGADILTGGQGRDSFRFITALDSNAAVSDIITDFEVGTDSIDLSVLLVQSIGIRRLDNGDSVLFAQGRDGAFQVLFRNVALTTENIFYQGFGAAGFNLTGSNNADVIVGSDFGDAIQGSSGDDFLTGGLGNDTLDGGAGADLMVGGLGDDTYYVAEVGDQATEASGEGTDSVYTAVTYSLSGQQVENLILTGSTAIDATGNALANTLTGNAGNNVLNGGEGIDVMSGGLGDDTYYVDNVGDRAVESDGQGADLVVSSISYSLALQYVENLILTGSTAIDATGNALANTLTGNAGNNVLNGGEGIDTMSGGLGDDTYYVDNVGDLVVEADGEGTDLIYSSVSYSLALRYVENLTLSGSGDLVGTGNTLNNLLIGNSGANRLSGADGADVLIGDAGADTLTGGAGADTFRYLATADTASGSGDYITDFQTGVDRLDLNALSTTQLSLVRSGSYTTLYGTAGGTGIQITTSGDLNGSDIDYGGTHGVFIQGSAAGDVLIGSANNDPILGYGGNDVLIGGRGQDILYGGAGADAFRYLAVSDSNATTGADYLSDFVSGEDRIDLMALATTQISLIRDGYSTYLFAATSGGAFQLVGFGVGLQGSDIAYGADHGIFMVGAANNDLMIGSNRGDAIVGGDGADAMIGGAGADALFGGNGNDVFYYFAASDSTLAVGDRILDFEVGFDRVDLTTVRTGAADSFGIIHQGGGSFLFVDLGGNGTNDMLISFANATVTAADIVW